MKQEKKTTFADMASAVMEFDKVVVTGLICCVAAVLVFSFVLAKYGNSDSENVKVVLSYFKDLSFMLVPAIAASIRHKDGEK